ncbi:MAG: hypothetical protein DWQ05_18365 [Calditrichaeota bacterium]|nr:MAG: hypothetical protein DWQ05_18365 [Calditrichota bacterium]
MKTPKIQLAHIFKDLELEKHDPVERIKWPQTPIDAGVKVTPTTQIVTQRDAETVACSETVSYPVNELGSIAFHRLHNKFLLQQLEPRLLQGHVLVPAAGVKNSLLTNNVLADLETLATRFKLQLKPLDIQSYPGITDPILFLSLSGNRRKEAEKKITQVHSGMQIILIYPLAAVPIRFLTELYADKISDVFDPLFLKLCTQVSLEKNLSIRALMRLRRAVLKQSRLFLLGEGGISRCCYEISAQNHLGIELDLEALPMHVPAKLLCDLFRLDPLCIDSTGSVLLFIDAEQTESILATCTQNQVAATLIGETTDSHDLCLFTNLDGRKSRIYKPQFDELHRYRFSRL